MQMPGRSFTANNSGYRYGFNGKEKDSEVKGEGNQYDYGMRIYDPRIGRFLSVDPIAKDYPELTPYQYASNRPIDGIDLDGLEYAPAGLFGPNGPRESTSVKLYPTNATQMQQNTMQIASRVNYLNQWIAAPNIYGDGVIGPRYAVQSNIAIAKQNYYNAVGDNIAGGPFGATDYLLNPKGGGFAGAAVDGVAMSFGGISGETTVGVPNYKPVALRNSSIETTTSIAPFEQSPINISVRLNKSWTAEEVSAAYNKAQAMSDNPNTKVTLENPQARIQNTRGNFIKNGGVVAKGQHVDHVTELQLNGNNGSDGRTNLAPLSGRVNTSFGGQIYQQIKNVPDNTRVNKVVINPFTSKK